MSWRDFWSGEHAIYANARHRLLHFETIAREVAALIPAPDAVVLDYGCGEAMAADLIAAKCGRLYLHDIAPKVEAGLRQRWANADKIVVLSEAELKALPDGSLDMVIFNSIFQYLSREDCRALVVFAARILKLGGRVVVGDVIPPHVDSVADSLELLNFAYRGGFLLAALRRLGLSLFSRYARLRAHVGVTTFTIPDMLRLLSIEGFEARHIAQNIGHNHARMSFIGKRL